MFFIPQENFIQESLESLAKWGHLNSHLTSLMKGYKFYDYNWVPKSSMYKLQVTHTSYTSLVCLTFLYYTLEPSSIVRNI